MRRMRRWILLLAAAAVPGALQAQQQVAKPSVYAVNAAALSAAMTHCIARHKDINQGGPGAECFSRARTLLGELRLSTWSDSIERKCTDAATYNRCMTPEIGRLVFMLNDTFKARGL